MTSTPALWAVIVVHLIVVVALVVLGIRSLIVMRHRNEPFPDSSHVIGLV